MSEGVSNRFPKLGAKGEGEDGGIALETELEMIPRIPMPASNSPGRRLIVAVSSGLVEPPSMLGSRFSWLETVELLVVGSLSISKKFVSLKKLK